MVRRNKQPSSAQQSLRTRRCSRKLGAVELAGQQDSKVEPHPAKRQRLDPGNPATSATAAAAAAAAIVTPTVAVSVTELNSQAMSHYSRGDFDTAASLFRRAIAISSKSPYNQYKCAPTTTSTNQTRSKSSSAHDKPPSSSYIYQRTDFDEGLNVYCETIPLSADDPPQVVATTLLFNAGQARKKLKDMEGAAEFYEQAIQTLLPVNTADANTATNIVSTNEEDQAMKSFLPATNTNDTKTVSTDEEWKNQITYIPTQHTIIIPLLHTIGQLKYRRGELKEALSVYQVALRHCEEIHGKDDRSVGHTLNCLGVVSYHLSCDASEGAKTYFERALETIGEGTLESATTLNNLGRVHVQREEFETALVCYEKSIAIRKALGKDHIDYAATAFNAGQSLHQLGKLDEALVRYKEFLSVALKRFGNRHRDVAVVLSGIAQIHQEKKEYDRALQLYEESLIVGREALGNSHAEVAMLLNRLGNFFFDRGDFSKALTAYEEGLQIEQKVLEEAHPNIIVTLTNIGEIHRQRHDVDNSILQYVEALRLQRKCYGSSSIEAASSLNVLGLLYDSKGNSTAALACFQEALVIRRSVLGDDHLEVSATLACLGTVFFRRGANRMALQLFSEALRIRIKEHGKDNRDVAYVAYNVGLCHYYVGSYKEAIQCYNETLRIERLLLGEDHSDIAMTLSKLGETHAANNDLDEALQSYEGAYNIEKAKSPKDPMAVARILNDIANIYTIKGNTQLMMESLSEAARVLKEAGLAVQECIALPDKLYGFASVCPSSAAAA